MAKNNSLIQPYLFFEGRCEEAIAFYKRAAGAEVGMLMRFKDCPEPPPGLAPGSENKVMHAQITIGQSVVPISGGRCSGKLGFAGSSSGFSLSITLPTQAEIDRRFKALSEGGKVIM